MTLRMTPRQERIEFSRIDNAAYAESVARFIHEGWGSYAEWEKSIPAREWIRGENGLWHSEARKNRS